jgi:hypothetical protein
MTYAPSEIFSGALNAAGEALSATAPDEAGGK